MIKRLFNFLTCGILLAILLAAAALIAPKLLDYPTYAVISGSMEPALHVGSIVIVKPVKPEQIKVGDPITFEMNNQSGVVATHRVIEIDSEKKQFITKGDANEVKDISPISFDRLIGKCVLSIPLLGYLSLFMQNASGRYIVLTAFVALLLLMLLPELFRQNSKQSKSINCNNSIE